jgi:SAM-dependent methyltransferase
MTGWSDGYVVDQEYTTQFFQELAPAHLNLAAMQRGVAPPEHDGETFRYCELGCGNGLTTAVLAAANPKAEIHGIDFMPVHISNARRLARDGGVDNVAFHEMAFADAVDADFPQFDYIVTHGVYSWITPENRREITDFIRKFLAPGGLVYVSYNALPGWSTIAPLQRLLSEYAAITPGQSTHKVKTAIQFAQRLKNSNAAAFAANPRLAKMLEGLEGRPVNYLAQEYLNQAWYPLYVTEAMDEMNNAKVSFAASATLMENNLRFLLSQEQQTILNELPTAELRELTRDFFLNSQFRRDIYSRGGRRLTRNEQASMFSQQVFALRVAPDGVKYEAKVMGREAKFDNPNVRAVVEALGSGPKSLQDLIGVAGDFQKAYSAIEALLISSQAMPLMRKEGAGAESFNAEVVDRALTERAVSVLATPYGTGIPAGAVDQLFFKLHAEGATSADELANRAVQAMAAKGRRVQKEGQALDNEAAVEHLKPQAERFLTASKPALEALNIQTAQRAEAA